MQILHLIYSVHEHADLFVDVPSLFKVIALTWDKDPMERISKEVLFIVNPLAMRNEILLLIILAIRMQKAFACTAGVCAVSGTRLGILQQINQHYIGLQFYENRFENYREDGTSLKSSTTYSIATLNFGWQVFPFWQMTTDIAYRMHYFIEIEM